MTSLAALTYAARTTAPAFNGLFFATAATIIPVLFLALAVQGRGYENVLEYLKFQAHRVESRGWTAYIAMCLFLAAFLIPAYGTIGEIVAVYALYQEQAGSVTTQNVLAAAILLTAMTAVAPVLAFVRNFFDILDGQAAPQHPADTAPDGEAQSETDKPDPA